MPQVPFSALPDSSRVWIFASDRALTGIEAARLLALADDFLAQWKAHGVALRCGRDWRDDRFLTIGVDPTQEEASGCSIDGLFRALQSFQDTVASRLVGGGRVFYRDEHGGIRVVHRDEWERLAKTGEVGPDTQVFDLSLITAGDYRRAFEVPAAATWVAELFVA